MRLIRIIYWVQLPKLSDAVIDWSQVISASLALIALLVALIVARKASKDIVRERNRQFELDTLRESVTLHRRRAMSQETRG